MEPTTSGAKVGWVSVWLADFTQELDLDGYSNAEFARDHGVTAGFDGEYAVRTSPVPLAEIFARFWLAPRWAPSAIAACEAQGIAVASCAVVRAHYQHRPAGVAPGPLRFVCCVALSASA